MSASLADIILLSRLAAKRSTDELKAELGITQMDAFALRRALRNGTINRYCTEGDIFSACVRILCLLKPALGLSKGTQRTHGVLGLKPPVAPSRP